MADSKVGRIDHYYDNISVAVLEVTDNTVSVGDTIKITDKDGEERFTQKIESIQVDHENVDEANKGDAVGLKVDQPVKEGDLVYRT
jgi:translation initiation factor IF-2